MKEVHTRKRGKTWSYWFEIEANTDGKRQQKTASGFLTEADAYKAGIEAYDAWCHGELKLARSKNLTVADYLVTWIDAVRHNLAPSSVNAYQSHIKTISEHTLGKLPLNKVEPLDVANFYRQLYEAKKSYKTIAAKKAVLIRAFKYAVHPARLLRLNPATNVEIPDKAPRNIVKRVIISADMFDNLMEAYPPGNKYHIPIMIAYHTGMRIGEVLGLTWDLVDFERNIITVKQQSIYIKGLGTIMGPPKTPAGYREIMIDSILAQALLEWKELQTQNSQYLTFLDSKKRFVQATYQLNEGYTHISLVCTDIRGKRFSNHALSDVLKAYELNSHSFRHTHTTLLVENRATPKAISARLGHADTLLAQKLYAHVTDKLVMDAGEVAESMLTKMLSKANKMS